METRIAVAVLLITSLFTVAKVAEPVSAQYPTFGSAVNLSSNAGLSQSAKITTSGNYVYLVWQYIFPPASSHVEILFRVSTNGGVNFGPSITLNNITGPHSASEPQIAVSGSYVYVVWSEEGEIFFRVSNDNGANFGSIVNLSNNTEGSFSPAIAVSGSYVYVVWSNGSGDLASREILFRASNDNGASFGPTINLSDNDGIGYDTQIAAVGSYVYVVWSDITSNDIEILFRGSNDNGANFGPLINLSDNDGISMEAWVTISANNVYITWRDMTPSGDCTYELNSFYGPCTGDILFRASNDNGANFGPIINLSDNDGPSGRGHIAVSGTYVYVAWRDDTLGNPEILFRASNDNGASFGPTVNLSNTGGYSDIEVRAASITAIDNDVYVAWQDASSGNLEILFTASSDNGASFGQTINLSDSRARSLYPQIAASGSNVHVIWQEREESNLIGIEDIFYARSPPLPNQDTPKCRGLPATIVGTIGNDTIIGTDGDDVIVGLKGNDIIEGAGGNDVICGGAGNDTIRGGDGNDIMAGGAGRDFILGEEGDDEVYGGGGNDAMDCGDGTDIGKGGRGRADVASNCETVQGIP